jgi:hypothetical protein
LTSMKELVNRAKAGNQAAMMEIIERYLWMIDAHSRVKGMVDEDCKHAIIEQAIKAVRRF